ncbi:MAG TPA: hypothetical protein VNH64_06935 [Parvularculaceae bacterium]|nr:hypothetical protein [Parvularculaceae bacterium]
MRLTRNLTAALIGAGALLASGCWATFWDGGYYGPTAGAVYVHSAPPPAPHYVVPPRPVIGAIWIGGYWRWSGARYDWVDGYWDRSPPPRKRWQPGRWSHAQPGWYWTPGRWR